MTLIAFFTWKSERIASVLIFRHFIFLLHVMLYNGFWIKKWKMSVWSHSLIVFDGNCLIYGSQIHSKCNIYQTIEFESVHILDQVIYQVFAQNKTTTTSKRRICYIFWILIIRHVRFGSWGPKWFRNSTNKNKIYNANLSPLFQMYP